MPGDTRDSGERRGSLRLFPILAAALALAVMGAGPPTIADDFDAAVARLKVPPGASVFGARVGLDYYRSEAGALAKAHGPAAAGFLRSRTNGPDPFAARLALMTLAALAHDPNAATELTGCLRDSNFRNRSVLMALTYAPAPVALAVADEAFASRNAQPEALAAASLLFRFFGDAHRASALEEDLARRPASVSKVTPNLVALRQRLARPDEERPAWAAQDLIVWRAIRSKPNTASLNVDLWRQTAAACALTRFTSAYLKDRLGSSIIDWLELRLLLMIAGTQREAALIPELTRLLETGRAPAGDAMNALLSIGTRDALAPVERLITPPKAQVDRGPTGDMTPARLEADMRQALVHSLCQDLAQCGDRATLDLMKTLATDTKYPPEERAAFARARNALQARLGASP